MKDLTVAELEDYFTGKLAGITVVNRQIEFPKAKKALNIEGEKNYFLIQDETGNYTLQDDEGKARLILEDEGLSTFLQHIVELIAEEEASFDL